MKTYYIYKFQNKINGKIYIGKTNDLLKRYKEHLFDRRGNSMFHRAIDKYGVDSFSFDVVATAKTQEQANTMERLYIALYKSYKPNGYNMTKGGDGGSMWNAIPVVRLTVDGEFVKRYDSATEPSSEGFCVSDVLTCCRDAHRSCNGYTFMFESEYLEIGGRKKLPKRRTNTQVYQCSLNGEFIRSFDSVREASNALGILHSGISSCLTGRYKSCGGYIFVYPKDFPIKDIKARKPKKKGKRIAKVDIETNEIIKIYDRVADAGRDLGVSYKAIHKVVDKDGRTAYGFKWISQ